MTWIFLGLTTTLLLGAHTISSKKVLVFENALKFLTVLSSAQFIILFPIIPLIKIPSSEALFLIIVQSFILTVGLMLQFSVLKKLPISTVAPLNNLMPLFLYAYAFFILGEVLNEVKLTGLLILILGAYLVNFSPNSILEPLKNIFRRKYEQWLIVSIMVLAVVAMMDKLILIYRVDVLSLLFFSQLFLAINAFLWLLGTEGTDGVKKAYQTKGAWVLLTGILKNLGNLTYLTAVSLVPVALVLPFRQLSSFIAAVFGGTIFKEKGLLRKALASIIMVIGLIVISL